MKTGVFTKTDTVPRSTDEISITLHVALSSTCCKWSQDPTVRLLHKENGICFCRKNGWGSKPGQVVLDLVVHCLFEVTCVSCVAFILQMFWKELSWPVPVWHHMRLLNTFNSQQPRAYKDKRFAKRGAECATSSQPTPLIHGWARGPLVGIESSVTTVLEEVKNVRVAFAETRDRTRDLQIFSLTLSQLSYFGEHSSKNLQFSAIHYMMKVL